MQQLGKNSLYPPIYHFSFCSILVAFSLKNVCLSIYWMHFCCQPTVLVFICLVIFYFGCCCCFCVSFFVFFWLHINVFFPECVILVKSLSFHQFKDADPLYSGCHRFWREVRFFVLFFSNQCSFVCNVLFFSSCFQDFFFIFGFHTFGYAVHRYGFLYVLPAWSLLSFLDL